MSLEKMIKIAKGQADIKAPVSIKLPLYLKEQLVEMTTKNEITINAFLIALSDDVLNGELKDKTNLEAVEKMESLIKKRKEILKLINDGETNIEFLNGTEVNLNQELNDNEYMIKLLQRTI